MRRLPKRCRLQCNKRLVSHGTHTQLQTCQLLSTTEYLCLTVVGFITGEKILHYVNTFSRMSVSAISKYQWFPPHLNNAPTLPHETWHYFTANILGHQILSEWTGLCRRHEKTFWRFFCRHCRMTTNEDFNPFNGSCSKLLLFEGFRAILA